MASRFSIAEIIGQVGESLTLTGVAVDIISDRGDETVTETDYNINGYVDEMSGDEKVVEEGLLTQGDIIVFIDEDETHVDQLVLGNHFTRNSIKYEIKNVIHNLGHYEVHCKRK